MSNDYAKAAKIAGSVVGVAGALLIPGFGLSSLIEKSAKNAITKSNNAVESGDIKKLQEEAAIQEIENRISEFQARVAQELAIARRIENAYEVEIEEFYDSSGDGSLGAQYKEGTLNLGATGSGRRVKSRIYRFKGFANVVEGEYNQDSTDEK
jgi:hypothetical protein